MKGELGHTTPCREMKDSNAVAVSDRSLNAGAPLAEPDEAPTAKLAATILEDDARQPANPWQSSVAPSLPSTALPSFRGGERVAVFGLQLSGYPLIEGMAVILMPVPGCPHEYWVRFPGDPRPRRRFVLPGDFQLKPETMLDALRAVWRAGPAAAQTAAFLTTLQIANDNEEGMNHGR